MQPYLPLTNSSFSLRLSESQEVLYLGQICQNSEARIWKIAYCHQLVHPFSGKARCFSQSERALYGDVIITKYIYKKTTLEQPCAVKKKNNNTQEGVTAHLLTCCTQLYSHKTYLSLNFETDERAHAKHLCCNLFRIKTVNNTIPVPCTEWMISGIAVFVLFTCPVSLK